MRLPGPPPETPATGEADFRVWQRLAPLGLLLVGAGTAVTADASARRAAGAGAPAWVAQGTAGLVLLNAGLSVFGEAVKRRALFEAAARGGHGSASPQPGQASAGPAPQ